MTHQLFTDGSSCIDCSGAGLIITNSEGMEFTYDLRFRFDATSNEAEYEALIAGLRIAEQMGVKNLQANVDSRLVANQVNGTYIAKEPGMIKYLDKNSRKKSINEKELLTVVEEEGRTWMTLIYEYLTEEILPEEKRKARAIRRKAAIDYFTKWIEAKPVATITGAQVKKFVWDNIVCRFGLPGEIISDNGKQFRDNPFKDWCEKLCEGIKARNAILADIWNGSSDLSRDDMIKNDEALEINLDLLEERREHAVIQEAKSKAMMEKYYNARLRNTSFKPGDLIYRSNEVSHAEDGGKLEPKWEGPYEVTEALGN
ncbi:reverse transcriptase domain-containing protein [Tanacetum coccineum]